VVAKAFFFLKVYCGENWNLVEKLAVEIVSFLVEKLVATLAF
jgi:hypothetical protein